MTRPAIWMTAIIGMAMKLRASPAIPTRENTRALTGSNANSAASVALKSAAAACATRDIGDGGDGGDGGDTPDADQRSYQPANRRAQRMMPSVAPNDSQAPTSTAMSGSFSTRASATTARTSSAAGRSPTSPQSR